MDGQLAVLDGRRDRAGFLQRGAGERGLKLGLDRSFGRLFLGLFDRRRFVRALVGRRAVRAARVVAGVAVGALGSSTIC
jgi:hypothetical protein